MVDTLVGAASLHAAVELSMHMLIAYQEHRSKWKGPPINHDLEKAFQHSVFSALQEIAIDCQKQSKSEETQKWLDEKREQLEGKLESKLFQEWLVKKFKQLTGKLSAIGGETLKLFDSLDHLQSFLVAAPELAQELKQEEAKQRLIEFALKDDSETPLCYSLQVEAGLFEKVREHFIHQIKYNEPVRSVLMMGGLAGITGKMNQTNAKVDQQSHKIDQTNAKVDQQSHKIDQTNAKVDQQSHKIDQMNAKIDQLNHKFDQLMIVLMSELHNFKAGASQAKVKVEGNLNIEQVAEIKEAFKQRKINVLWVEDGCIIIVVEGSETAIKQLENLTEIAGYRVENVTIIPGYPLPEKPVVSLLKWLQKQFDESIIAGWQTLDEIFGPKELAFRFRGDKTERAKEFDLGNGTVVVLLIQIEEKEPDIQVILEVRAKDLGLLPVDLILLAFQDIGSRQKSRAGENDDFIKQVWLFSPDETFTVSLNLGDNWVTEVFSI